jgi:flagellar basal-body rod protein FlgF
MIKGLYAAVSAMLTNANRQEILAHNIANLQTPGFKEILTSVEDFVKSPVTYSPGNILGNDRLVSIGALGLGSEMSPETIDFSQGAIQMSQSSLDFAIQGDGFFTIKTPTGTRYTRDGRFIRNAQNNLVTIEGYAVLDQNQQPIKLPDGIVTVATDGTILSGAANVGKFGIAMFKNPRAELKHDMGNMFSSAAAPTGVGIPNILQSALESSNANETYLTTEMMEVARSYEAAQKMVQNQDELLGKAISSLGRIG